MSSIHIPRLPQPISFGNRILLTGSCFTEHIGNALADHKFEVIQNPHGILFNPASVEHSLIAYLENKKYTEEDLFFLNEVWHSWYHHSVFSGMNKKDVLHAINESVEKTHQFLKSADWMIITLGSAFSYTLSSDYSEKEKVGLHVANCHRAPAQWFRKQLLDIDEIVARMDQVYHRFQSFNPKINMLLTVSPVRHLRDGVIENNRSKARLIEAVHHLADKFPRVYYFPAYELVIDVLRDYRFYDTDMAHPNYAATEFVWEQFVENCIDPASWGLMKEVRQIMIARKHKPFYPETHAHKQFMQMNYEKAVQLQSRYPLLHLEEEIAYFSNI